MSLQNKIDAGLVRFFKKNENGVDTFFQANKKFNTDNGQSYEICEILDLQSLNNEKIELTDKLNDINLKIDLINSGNI